MLPWGHAAVGYLCYSFIVRVRDRRAPTGPAVLTLAVGTQLPDLIDKPLAWSLGILPSGRSLGHSLLFAVLLTIVVWVVAQRYDRQREVSALMVGHLLHVLADSTPALIAGNWEELGSLLWPLTPVYQYTGEMDQSIIGFFLELDLTALPLPGVVLSLLAIGVWIFDGRPGIDVIRDRRW
ncbi:metal-dependent hydrolase [Halorubrum lacusprofundi]|uniref:metal-dependent hydrolase n=1 Tax=Halorubrum lacusprofundi TaxID=2247 RepID=UPI000B5A44BF|nr:metal-dependent hydrolase [Halorubrum lacusprofundi]MCG1007638.1 metal-dependent hydrolase [Halorubrum lacusprofundi]